MTIVVEISGGQIAYVKTIPFIFKNANCSYPIRELHDSLPGLCYRTGPKGWIDRRVFHNWVQKPRDLSKIPNNRRRVLLCCSTHNMSEEFEKCLKKSARKKVLSYKYN